MKIEHLALWVENLEMMKDFYCHYFNLSSGEKYHTQSKTSPPISSLSSQVPELN